MRLRKKMNNEELGMLKDKLEDTLINEHRLIKENVGLKEKVLDYASRLDRANDEIDCLTDRIAELEEEVSDKLFEIECWCECNKEEYKYAVMLAKRNKELVKILYDIGVDVRGE